MNRIEHPNENVASPVESINEILAIIENSYSSSIEIINRLRSALESKSHHKLILELKQDLSTINSQLSLIKEHLE